MGVQLHFHKFNDLFDSFFAGLCTDIRHSRIECIFFTDKTSRSESMMRFIFSCYISTSQFQNWLSFFPFCLHRNSKSNSNSPMIHLNQLDFLPPWLGNIVIVSECSSEHKNRNEFMRCSHNLKRTHFFYIWKFEYKKNDCINYGNCVNKTRVSSVILPG